VITCLGKRNQYQKFVSSIESREGNTIQGKKQGWGRIQKTHHHRRAFLDNAQTHTAGEIRVEVTRSL
jgi:hypothetical protein